MPITQAQIAEMAGVSRATVDRVVNNRGKVDAAVEAKIRSLIAEHGYQHNKAGSLLARSRKPLRIGVVIQLTDTPFLKTVLDEIKSHQGYMLQRGAEIIVKNNPKIDADWQLHALEELDADHIDGIAILPTEDQRICDKINELVEKGIPVVTFNTDMPYSKRLCYVGQDAYKSGQLCAGLMSTLLSGKGSVLPIVGNFANLSHRMRNGGFQSELTSLFPGIKIRPVETCHDDDEATHRIVYEHFKNEMYANGIYIVSSGQIGICDALRELNLQNKIRLVCHDVYPAMIDNILNGTIDYTIDQDARRQALDPLKILTDYLLSGIKPEQELNLIRNDIVCKYNVF